MSRIQSLQFFVSSIADPHNLQHCGKCLDGAFRQCTDVQTIQLPILQQETPSKNKTKKHNPELWDAVVKLLFIKRTKKQMTRFLTRLAECNCRMDPQAGNVELYHRLGFLYRSRKLGNRVYNDCLQEPGKQKFMDAWRPFLLELFESLSTVIGGSTTRLLAKGAASSWPISSTDIFPYGPDALVSSILQWYEFIPDPVFFRLISNILVVSRELLIPSLTKYKFTKTVIETTRHLLDRVVEDHLSGPNPERMEYLPYQFAWQASDTLEYLGACYFVVLHKDYTVALYQDYEIKATQLISLILYVLDALQNCTKYTIVMNKSRFCMLGHHLFHTLARSPQDSFPVHPGIKEIPPSTFIATPEDQVLDMLRELRDDMRCSAIGCMSSLHTAGKGFQRCGKCGIAPYCGRDCQINAWKDGKFPHKKLCPIIVDMVEKAGGLNLFAKVGKFRPGGDTDAVGRIIDTMGMNWRKAHIDHDALLFVAMWIIDLKNARGCTSGGFTTGSCTTEESTMGQYQRDLSPGFTDYDTMISQLSSMKGASKPVYLDPIDRPRPFAELAQTELRKLDEHQSQSI